MNMVNNNWLQLFNQLNNPLWVLLAIFARCYGAMFICPFLNSSYTTRMLKAALALIFALIIFPFFHTANLGTSIFTHIFFLAKEFLYGLLIGYLVSLPIWLVASMGSLIDLQRGEQLGAIVNRTTNTPDSSIGKLLNQGFIVYFISVNGLLFFFDMLFNSWTLIPIDKVLPLTNIGVDKYIGVFANYFYWLIVLVMPVLLSMFLLELILGLISSFIPQLNVTVISMPLKSALALLILVFYLTFMYHQVITKFLFQVRVGYV